MCKTFSPANQIAQNKHNDEELELFKEYFIYFIYDLDHCHGRRETTFSRAIIYGKQ